jgi:hypothetical protein
MNNVGGRTQRRTLVIAHKNIEYFAVLLHRMSPQV